MTRPIRIVLTSAAFAALVGCSQLTGAANTVCKDIATLPPVATSALALVDPHSALGVLWADAKSACVAGVPAAGVDADWGGMVWGELKALAPLVLPALMGFL